jgi:hypothetical protein
VQFSLPHHLETRPNPSSPCLHPVGVVQTAASPLSRSLSLCREHPQRRNKKRISTVLKNEEENLERMKLKKNTKEVVLKSQKGLK